MRQVNLRALVICLVSLLVVAAGVYWLHGYQVRRNADVLLRAAETAKEAGNTAEAVRNLDWYVGLVPKDVDAWVELGHIYDNAGDIGSAYSTFENVLRLDPEREEVRRRVVRIALALQRFTDAREHLQDYLLRDNPDDPELLYWLGQCQGATGEFEPAVASYRRAVHADPENLEIYLRLATVLRHHLDRPPEADEAVRQMVEANPDSCKAHIYRAQYIKANATPDELRDGAANEIAKEAAAALKASPDDVDALLLAARCDADRKDFRAARRYAGRAERLYPSHAPVFSVLADIELKSGNREESLACLKRGLKGHPDNLDLLWNLAMLQVDDDRLDEADKILQRLKAGRYSPALTGYLEGRIHLLRGDWLRASRLFETYRNELSGSPDLAKQADYCLGKCYHELGEPILELRAYRRAVAIDSAWAPPRVSLAAALVAAGRLEEAFRQYQEIVALDGAPKEAPLQLARLALLRNLARNPADRNTPEVVRYLAQAAKATPDDPAIAILQAEIYFTEDFLSQAAEALQDALQRQPNEVELYVALAALADRRGEPAKAEEYLDKADKRFGRRAELLLARAQHYARGSDDGAGQEIRQLLKDDENFNDADKIKFQKGMAGVLLQLGDYEHARQIFQQVSKMRPNDLATRTILFDLALQANDTSGLKEQIEQIEQITGKSPLWQYARAVYLTLTARPGGDNFQEALKCLADARVARPEWPRLPLLAAKIQQQLGNQDRAIEEYLQAIDLGERSPMAVRQVVDLLCRQQRYLEADRVIRRLGQQATPFSNQMSRFASEVALQMADFDRAQRMARQAAERSNDYGDHIWLGQVLGMLGQRAKSQRLDEEAEKYSREAEAELRKAISLAEQSPMAWLALIQFFERSDQKDKAQQTIQEAEKAIDHAKAPLAIAQCYDAAGKSDEAARRYEQALAASPNDAAVVRQVAGFFVRSGKSEEAERLLNRIVNGEIKARRSDVLWARGNLAMIFVGRGGYKNLQHAIQLVDENLAVDPYSVRDQRAKVLMLASSPGRKERGKAIQTLEDYLQTQQSATPEERMLLARLYLAADDWPSFRRHMQRVLTDRGDEPSYLSLYIRELLARNDTSEASLWLSRLEEVAPGQLETMTFKAKLAAANKEYAKAFAIVKDYLTGLDPNAKPPGYNEAIAASVLEEIGLSLRDTPNVAASARKFLDEAEAVYRNVAKKNPERGLVLVPFLARQNRINEALDVAERYWRAAAPGAIQLGLSPVLTNAGASNDQLDRAEKVLQAAIDANHNPVNLLLLLGDLCSMRGKAQESEKAYREVLDADPDNVGAMNNLAVLLASQGKDLAEAEKIISRAIAISGPQTNLLDTRATVYLASKKPQDAVNDLLPALDEKPSATLYFHLAQAQHQLGRSNAARNSLKEGYKLGLSAETLHPLERDQFRTLLAALR